MAVVSLKIPENMADIKPLAEFEAATPYLLYILAVTGLILIICLTVFLVLKFIKKQKEKKNNIPLYERSLKSISEIENKNMDIFDKWVGTSDILRGYITQKYFHDKTKFSDVELVKNLDGFVPDEYLEDLRRFFRFSSEIKFSNENIIEILNNENFNDYLKIIREFVKKTGNEE